VTLYVKPGVLSNPDSGGWYVVNNSLVHELRHVQQEQADTGFGQKYQNQNATVGYYHNGYEVEARFYGRLAQLPGGKKDTGPAGKPLGKKVWGIK